jgi:hypothetical protein
LLGGLTGLTGILALTAIDSVGTTDPLFLAALAGFLEFGRNDELAVDTTIFASCARIIIATFNERTVIVANIEAGFATSTLGVTDSQLVDREIVASDLH